MRKAQPDTLQTEWCHLHVVSWDDTSAYSPSDKTTQCFAGESRGKERAPNRNVDTDRQTDNTQGSDLSVVGQ